MLSHSCRYFLGRYHNPQRDKRRVLQIARGGGGENGLSLAIGKQKQPTNKQSECAGREPQATNGVAVRVRADIIGLARTKYVGKSKSCMV